MQIEIWSDVICPWCYIGKRRFEQALAQSGMRDDINIIWRSFELDPKAPQQHPGTLIELLSRKYGVSAQQAAEMNERVSNVALEVGLKYRLSDARPGNTFDAHRLLHYAATQQKGDAAMEAIMNAYFSEALPVGDRAALAKLAPQFGIAEEQALALLVSDEFTAEVRADESRAAELGISGVPFFVFDGKTAISGVQPVEAFVRMLSAA
ncbi:MAG: DsbA family oxidoreductase [Gallionella sp.]|nr:DsbA family oxidoreductase [Gallionella sp.]